MIKIIKEIKEFSCDFWDFIKPITITAVVIIAIVLGSMFLEHEANANENNNIAQYSQTK